MPVHNWSKIDAGLFHAFHQTWITMLSAQLNAGLLPADYFALPEQNIRGPIPDVLTLHLKSFAGDLHGGPPGVAVADARPSARTVRRYASDPYIRKADRIAVRHRHGDVIAVIEIISPGNKAGTSEFRRLVEKSAALLRQGVHLLVIDLFPPTRRDPHGVHKEIWDEIVAEDFILPPDKPLIVAAYDATDPYVAYVEPIAVGDELPSLPLFLRADHYVPAPLESSVTSPLFSDTTAPPGFVIAPVAFTSIVRAELIPPAPT